MTNHTPVHALVSNVIGGSLLVQHAHTLNSDTSYLEDTNSPETLELYQKLTAHYGFDFEVTASHVLGSISALITDDEIAAYNIKYFASTLWKILGDPAQNGSEPPPIYFEAGKALYAWVVCLLYPTHLDH